MLLKQICRMYHIRKPRIPTQNKQSLREYRTNLRQARKNVHIQAKQYQDMIQDKYLQKHAQQQKAAHFNNECQFRTKIAQQGQRLKKNIQQWTKDDSLKQSRVNKFIHQQDLKRINRQRIKKIMTYQSQNYWYTSDNAEDRLIDDVIFPQYIATTEYYHRLHAEGLIYENYDFNMLHRVRSNEDVIKEKNKLLIPVFNDIKLKIKQYKTDKQKQLTYKHKIFVDRIKQNPTTSGQQKSRLIQQSTKQHLLKIEQVRSNLLDPIKKQNHIKKKLRILLNILASWKQYTNVLGMTSGQMMTDIQESRREGEITGIKKNVMNQIRSVKNTTFVDPIQEDTEDVNISLQDYIKQLKLQHQATPNEQLFDRKQANTNIELDSLLKQAEVDLKASKVDLTKQSNPVQKIDVSSMVSGLETPTQFQITEIPVSFLNFNDTTPSVEAMKQIFANDEDMIKLLDQIGQVKVEYPKLFEKIWASNHPIM